jgi:LysM repeat protein
LAWLVWLAVVPASVGCGGLNQGVMTPSPAPTPTASQTPEIGVAFATVAPPTVPVLQTTPTPLPTSTQTPTATPIVYQVVEGDTIWVIAAKSNRTVEEVLALNPSARPELLQIGQTLVLPPPATPIYQTSLATPVPLAVAVTSITAYQTPTDGLWLLGEVVNQASVSAQNVQVAIELLDEAGEILAVVNGWVAALLIEPGQSAPFGLLLPQSPATFAQARVSVVGGDSAMDLGTRYLDLAVVEGSVNIDEHLVTIAGEVINQGTENAGPILVVVTFRDAQGQVAGFQQLELSGPLPPGEAIPFALTAAPPGGIAVELAWLVQGLRLPAAP